MKPASIGLSCVLLGLLYSGCDRKDREDSMASPDALTAGVEELRSELEEVRQTRDTLQNDLDVMTRERVDVDGKVTRLQKEKAALEEQLKQARARLRELESTER